MSSKCIHAVSVHFTLKLFSLHSKMCDPTPRRSPNSGLDALLSYTSCTALVDVNHVDSLVFDWKVQVGFWVMSTSDVSCWKADGCDADCMFPTPQGLCCGYYASAFIRARKHARSQSMAEGHHQNWAFSISITLQRGHWHAHGKYNCKLLFQHVWHLWWS